MPVPRLRRSSLLCLALTGVIGAACAPAASAPASANARLLSPPKDSCQLAREDAAADPHLDVERVPTPVKMDPPPIRRPVPRNVLRRDGSAAIRVEVLVDTLGRPDMATFAVLESSNVWFTTGAKAAIAKWTFEPALRDARCRATTCSAPPPRRGPGADRLAHPPEADARCPG